MCQFPCIQTFPSVASSVRATDGNTADVTARRVDKQTTLGKQLTFSSDHYNLGGMPVGLLWDYCGTTVGLLWDYCGTTSLNYSFRLNFPKLWSKIIPGLVPTLIPPGWG